MKRRPGDARQLRKRIQRHCDAHYGHSRRCQRKVAQIMRAILQAIQSRAPMPAFPVLPPYERQVPGPGVQVLNWSAQDMELA